VDPGSVLRPRGRRADLPQGSVGAGPASGPCAGLPRDWTCCVAIRRGPASSGWSGLGQFLARLAEGAPAAAQISERPESSL